MKISACWLPSATFSVCLDLSLSCCNSASLVRSSGCIGGWCALCLVLVEVTRRVRLMWACITQTLVVLSKKKNNLSFLYKFRTFVFQHLCSSSLPNIAFLPWSLNLPCERTGYCYGNEWEQYKATVMRTRQSEASCRENLIFKHLCWISNKGAAGKGQQSLWMALCMRPTAYPLLG